MEKGAAKPLELRQDARRSIRLILGPKRKPAAPLANGPPRESRLRSCRMPARAPFRAGQRRRAAGGRSAPPRRSPAAAGRTAAPGWRRAGRAA